SAKAERNPKPGLWRSRSFATTRTARLATRTPPASHLVRLSSRNRARSCGSEPAAVSAFRPWLESGLPILPARRSARYFRYRLALRERRRHRLLGVGTINCLRLNEFFAWITILCNAQMHVAMQQHIVQKWVIPRAQYGTRSPLALNEDGEVR